MKSISLSFNEPEALFEPVPSTTLKIKLLPHLMWSFTIIKRSSFFSKKSRKEVGKHWDQVLLPPLRWCRGHRGNWRELETGDSTFVWCPVSLEEKESDDGGQDGQNGQNSNDWTGKTAIWTVVAAKCTVLISKVVGHRAERKKAIHLKYNRDFKKWPVKESKTDNMTSWFITWLHKWSFKPRRFC